jgi:uncharacterized protein involved in cysteine biosynthesis
MMVPALNFFAMPAAVAGATALWVGELKDLDAAGRSRTEIPHP